MAKKQSGSLSQFLKKFKSDVLPNDNCESNKTVTEPNLPGTSTSTQFVDDYSDHKVSSESMEDLEDIGKWPKVTEKIRVLLIEKGPLQTKLIKYQKDAKGRKLNNAYFNRKMENGETVLRTWLLYSQSLDSVFCFCCKIFATPESSNFTEGFQDWGNLSKALHRHETSRNHMKNFLKWKDLERELKNKTTIDCQEQIIADMERKHGILLCVH
ncbi:zinc finger MYM-type protein 5-like [Diabrotica virgifera virgifera]|uniref:TTF-type domain-containing protein n=1 Tax=Diabrotica virgifera virgifera TaxID=50390 RepID=A0ABM5KCQ8_DIAVI|nr:zinc finger MYM-type protein 5-like [Diabrotica virgifera virgifera]